MFVQPRSLEAMQNRPTSYAVNLIINNVIVARFGFTQRRGKAHLAKTLDTYYQDLIDLMAKNGRDAGQMSVEEITKEAIFLTPKHDPHVCMLTYGETERTIRTEMDRGNWVDAVQVDEAQNDA